MIPDKSNYVEPSRVFPPHAEKSSKSVKSNKQIKASVVKIAKQIKVNAAAISIGKEKWQTKEVTGPPKNVKEAGKPQIKVILEKGGITIACRVKLIKTMNEAIVYHKIMQSSDPLSQHLPRFLGVLDADGKQIDLTKELENIGEAGVMEKYKPAYIIIGDLVGNLGEKSQLDGEVNDFKFAKTTLIGNEGEKEAHGQSKHGAIYNWIKKGFFGLSDCSFAFQKATKTPGWYMWLINSLKRLQSVKNTEKILKNQFTNMSFEELKANIQSLKHLKEAVSQSNFTFADSSLLFIPIKTTREDGTTFRQVDIRLIDLSHGISRDEEIEGFREMKRDMAASIQEVIDIMTDLQYDAMDKP